MTAGIKRFGGLALLAMTCYPAAWSQVPNVGDYNVYFGSLHNHCEFSDGTGTAEEAYYTARNVAGLDFFSLSDHAEFLTQQEWQEMKAAADSFDEPGAFAAFWGFEWSSLIYGHLTVTGSADFTSSLERGTDNFRELNHWLDNCNGVAFLNHPGDYDGFGLEFRHFDTRPSDKIVGMELWNGTTGFGKYYYNEGYFSGDGNIGYYDEALVRGWRAGATGACDIHGGNWGSGRYRMAVLAGNLDRQSLMEAFKARRFYSTLDMNLSMSFKIRDMEMGSVLEPGWCQGEVLLNDADQEVFLKVELVKNGQVENTFDLSLVNPDLQFEIDTDPGDYYYIIVTQEDGDQAISSPIFISDAALPTGEGATAMSSTDAWNVRYMPGERISVHISTQHQDDRLCLSDASGHICFDSLLDDAGDVEISLKGLPSGLYLLFVPDHPEYGSQKIIVY